MNEWYSKVKKINVKMIFLVVAVVPDFKTMNI